jgi:excisionase family DNA binding protein
MPQSKHWTEADVPPRGRGHPADRESGGTVRRYTVREAATELGLSPATVYLLLTARKLRHERVGPRQGRIQIPGDALDEYRRGATVAVAVPTAAAPRSTVPPLKHLTARPSGSRPPAGGPAAGPGAHTRG